MGQGNEIRAGGKNWRLGAAVVVIVALAAGLYYFSGIQNFLGGNQSSTGTSTVENQPVYPKFSPTVSSSITSSTNPEKVITGKLTGKEGSVSVYKITAENWTYIPSRLVVKKGEQVNLNFTAVDRDYDLEIAAPIGAYVSIKKGETITMGFGADKVGTYEILCQKICPDGKNMKGELMIIE